MEKSGTQNDLLIFDAIQNVTIQQATSSRSRSFNQLVRIDNVNKNDIIKVVSGVIERVIKMAYNLPNPLTQAQSVIMVARLMRYEELGFEDAVLIVKKGLFGEFGKIYNKFDLDTWDEWIDKYMDQRIDEVQRQYNQTKETAGTPNRDTRVVGLTDKMLDRGTQPPDEKMFENK